MSRFTKSTAGLPQKAKTALEQLGRNIQVARKRRGISLEVMADRVFAAVNTVRRVEAGNPRVAIGVYASVLFVLGLTEDLSRVADPDRDAIGKAYEFNRLPKRVRAKQTPRLDF